MCFAGQLPSKWDMWFFDLQFMTRSFSMYKLRKRICAASATLDSKYSLTPSQICQLLSEITQLRGLTIMAEESPEGDLQFVLGEDVYTFFDTMSESVR